MVDYTFTLATCSTLSNIQASLTNQVLSAGRILLVLHQVVEEQLRIRVERSVRAVGRGGHKAVHLHGAIVAEVKVELVAGDGDLGDGRAALGDGPDAAIATEPRVVLVFVKDLDM